jgi:hypothetical protein
MVLEHTNLIFITPARVYCFLLDDEEDNMAHNLMLFVKQIKTKRVTLFSE